MGCSFYQSPNPNPTGFPSLPFKFCVFKELSFFKVNYVLQKWSTRIEE